MRICRSLIAFIRAFTVSNQTATRKKRERMLRIIHKALVCWVSSAECIEVLFRACEQCDGG